MAADSNSARPSMTAAGILARGMIPPHVFQTRHIAPVDLGIFDPRFPQGPLTARGPVGAGAEQGHFHLSENSFVAYSPATKSAYSIRDTFRRLDGGAVGEAVQHQRGGRSG